MPLSDSTIRQAKHGERPTKMADEKGLFLLLQPSGGKLWRLKYRIGGKEKKLGLGVYPDVSLKEARRRRDDARTLLASGIDPSDARKAEAAASQERSRNTFAMVANEYLDRSAKEGRAAVTIAKSRWLLSLLERDLSAKAVGEITPADLLASLRRVEVQGHRETAVRMRSLAGRIFRYAVVTSRASSDPARDLKGALLAPQVKHHSAIIEPSAVGALLRAIDGFQGHPLTALALKLTPHVFLRPGELRKAEWSEIDFARAVWSLTSPLFFHPV